MAEEAGLFFDVGPQGSDKAEKEIRKISQSFASLSGYVSKVNSDVNDLQTALNNGSRSSSAAMLGFSRILADGGKEAQRLQKALDSAMGVLSDPTSNGDKIQAELDRLREVAIANRDKTKTNEIQAAKQADLAIRGLAFAQFNDLVEQQERVLQDAKRGHEELAQLSKSKVQVALDAQVTRLRAAAHSADEFTTSVERLRPAVTALGGDLDKSIRRAHLDDMWRNLGEFKKQVGEFVTPIKSIGGGIANLVKGAFSLGASLQSEVLARVEALKKMPEGAGWEGRRAIDTSERRAGARLGVSEQDATRATLSVTNLAAATHSSIPELLKLSDALNRAGFSYEASTGQAGDYLRMTAKLVHEQGMSIDDTIRLAQVSDATGESMDKLAGSALMAERTFGKMGSLEELPGVLDQARKNALGLGRVFTGEMAVKTAASISNLGQLIAVKLKTGIKEATDVAKGFANEAANIADEYEMMLGGLSDGFSGKGLAALELFGQIGVNFESFVQSGGEMLPDVADKLAGLVKSLQGTGGALSRVRGLIGQAFGRDTATAILAAANSGKGFAATEKERAEAAKRSGRAAETTTKAWEAAESSMAKSIELSEKQFIVNTQTLQILSVTRDTVRDHLATINSMSDKVIKPMIDTFSKIEAAQGGLNVALSTSEARLAAISKILNTQEGERGLFSQDWTTRVMGASTALGAIASIGGSAGWANIGVGLKALGTFAASNIGNLGAVGLIAYSLKSAWDAADESAKAYSKTLKETKDANKASVEAARTYIEKNLTNPLDKVYDVIFGIFKGLGKVIFAIRSFAGERVAEEQARNEAELDRTKADVVGGAHAVASSLADRLTPGSSVASDRDAAMDDFARARNDVRFVKSSIRSEIQRYARALDANAPDSDDFLDLFERTHSNEVAKIRGRFGSELKIAEGELARVKRRLQDAGVLSVTGNSTMSEGPGRDGAEPVAPAPSLPTPIAQTSPAQPVPGGVSEQALAAIVSALSMKLDALVSGFTTLADKQAKLALDVQIRPADLRSWLSVEQRQEQSRR